MKILDLRSFLLEFVDKAFQLGIMEVTKFIFTLLIGSDEVVLGVLVLGFDQLELVGLLALNLLDLVLQEFDLATESLVLETGFAS